MKTKDTNEVSILSPIAAGQDHWKVSSHLNRAIKELIGGGLESKPLRLSDVQIDVLLLGVDHKLDRSSMGWSCDDPVNWSDSVRIYSPATIKALWNRGLLLGNSLTTRAA